MAGQTGHIFIESKTKRLTVNAKTMSDAVALDKDLAVMAEAIVQHYKNIRRALDGMTKWRYDLLPVYPIILTLEDWFIFSPRVDEMLERHVRKMLAEAGIPDTVLNDMPYTIASSHEFELAIQIVAQLDISRVMGKKIADDQRKWSLMPFIMTEFKEQVRLAERFLFAEDWKKLMPKMPDGTTFDSIRNKAPGK